jgi:nitrogen regulatory protein PII
MYALILILNDTDKMDKVQKIFYENGCGATSMDSEGLGKVLLQNHIDIPVFAGLRRIVEGNKPYNKTIISVLKDEKKLRKLVDILNNELFKEKKPGVGFMFVLPVLECYGSDHSKLNSIS